MIAIQVLMELLHDCPFQGQELQFMSQIFMLNFAEGSACISYYMVKPILILI